MIDINKKILITGGTGYIGTNLIKKLVNLGAKNISVFIRNDLDIGKIKEIGNFIEVYIISIENRNNIFEIIAEIKPEIVYHLAAKGTKSTDVDSNIISLINTNGIGTINLIDALNTTDTCKAFLYISTIYEYGPRDEAINEKMNIEPFGDYALSKSIGTLYATNKGKYGKFPIITYRLSSVYGPGDKGRIIPFIITNFLEGKSIKLYDIYKKRDFIYIDDVINALLNIDKVLKKSGDIINIGSGHSINIKELLDIVKNEIGYSSQNIIIIEDSPSTLHWEVDNTYMIEKLNIPITPFSKGIINTINNIKINL